MFLFYLSFLLRIAWLWCKYIIDGHRFLHSYCLLLLLLILIRSPSFLPRLLICFMISTCFCDYDWYAWLVSPSHCVPRWKLYETAWNNLTMLCCWAQYLMPSSMRSFPTTSFRILAHNILVQCVRRLTVWSATTTVCSSTGRVFDRRQQDRKSKNTLSKHPPRTNSHPHEPNHIQEHTQRDHLRRWEGLVRWLIMYRYLGWLSALAVLASEK
jgi:hypothetical protein